MKELRERVLRDGRNLGDGILKVDTFLSHQVDTELMIAVGRALAQHFAGGAATKVMTTEVSGVAPAFATAMSLGVPLVYARKSKPVTMPWPAHRETAVSRVTGHVVELLVSPEVLSPRDRVLIIDDFLSTGETIGALCRLVRSAGATLVGVGVVLEKRFEAGRERLAQFGVPIRALATITEMRDDEIVFEE